MYSSCWHRKYSSELFIATAVTFLLWAPPLHAQQDRVPKHEFRGAWIATVINLDWPSSRNASSHTQQRNLTDMIDGLKEAGINAVFFQVRSEADAMYASGIEPWSFWLTGEQGASPEPFYDPLEVAIEEAHKRGVELHAWINPYRASRGSSYEKAADHITKRYPQWVLTFGNIATLNPGLPEVRNHIARVIMDIVRRYDIDGVHFDDYFYPYPPNNISTEDSGTFAEHNRGITSIADWRRDNVNLLVAQVADSIRAVKPHVKFGISPFGIWKNGVPAGIVGLDAYNVIYVDPTAWLAAGTVDYLVPQLYWPFGGAQDYNKLARWWQEQINGRHLYIGHGLYRTDSNTFSGTLFSEREVPNQVLFNREVIDILGSVFFRAKNLTVYPSQGFAHILESDLYRYEALTPSMDWKDQSLPGVPENLRYQWTEEAKVTLTWDAPPPAESTTDPRFYAVYRVSSDMPPNADEVSRKASNLIAVTGELSVTDTPSEASEPYYYFVRAISSNSVEGMESNTVVLEARITATETERTAATLQLRNYPNPFFESTQIEYILDQAATVTLRIYNMLGQEVTTITNQQWSSSGSYSHRWDGTDADGRRVGSGAYYFILEANNQRVARHMALVR